MSDARAVGRPVVYADHFVVVEVLTKGRLHAVRDALLHVVEGACLVRRTTASLTVGFELVYRQIPSHSISETQNVLTSGVS